MPTTLTANCHPYFRGLRICLVLIFSFAFTASYSQSKIDSLLGKLDPQKFAASIAEKSKKLEDKLVAKSMKVLDKIQGQEEKIYRKLLSQ